MTALDEHLLDDADALAAADTSSVLRALAGAGAQVRQSVELTGESDRRWVGQDRPRAVVVAGRGGSALVADALAAVMGAAGPVPVVALSGSTLPPWVGALDLVICLSLSGRADGAVAIATEAGRRGATLLTVGANTSPLADVARQARGSHIPLPEPGSTAVHIATTRTALWSLLTPALLAAHELGLVPGGPDSGPRGMLALADVLDHQAEVCRPGSDAFVNPAKSLALELHDAIPVVLGVGQMGWVAARRASSVLSRTARVPAAFGALPDDAGDIVATFGGRFVSTPQDIFADPFVDGPDAARLRLLLLELEADRTGEVIADIAERSGAKVSRVSPDSTTPLQRFAEVVARVDFAVTYLALATGLNPAQSPQVADLRDALR